MMKNSILKTSTLVTTKDQVWCELADEAVILDLKSGVYYGLNAIGARVWSLLQEPKTVDAVLAALLEEYEVEPNRCQDDLLTLLQDLAERQLVEIKAELDGATK
jgi:hypothetical protein